MGTDERKAIEAEAKALEAEAKAIKSVSNLLAKAVLTPIEIAEVLEMPLEFVLNIQSEMQK